MKKILVLTATILLSLSSFSAQTAQTGEWKSKQFSTDWKEYVWEFNASDFVKGNNTIAFLYTGGSNKLCMKDANIYADSVVVMTDSTEYTAGSGTKSFVYTFKLDSVPTSLNLTANARTSGGTDSKGLICINGVLIIPEGTLEIGGSAFYGNTNIKKVVIPSTVQKIGGLAFHNCSNLAEANIPSSVASMGDAVFQNCPALTSVTIGEGLWSLSYRLFKTSGLTEITIPGNIRTIGKEVFQDCSSLRKVVLEDGVEEIGQNAFYATKIKNIDIPSSVVSIGNLAFHSCVDLESITIPNNVTEVGDAAFQNCKSLATAKLGSEMWKVNYRLFMASGLTKITIPANIRTIGKEAFQDCKYLKRVVIEYGVEEIEQNAFKNSAVEEIVVPSSVTTFGTNIISDKAVWVVSWGSAAFFYALENNFRIRFMSESDKDVTDLILAESKNAVSATATSWEAGDFTTSFERRKWDFSSAVSKPGRYIVTFKYTKGLHRLCLADALFVADGQPVAYFSEMYSAGSNPRQIVYEVAVPAGTEKLMLYALAKTSGGTDSYGTISVEYQGEVTAVDESVASVNVYTEGHTIVVENANDEICVYDVMGRLICRDVACRVRTEIPMEKSGIYVVKVGHLAKRVIAE